MTAYPRRKLSEVLSFEPRRKEQVDPFRAYKTVGVRSFGGGCFESGDLLGSDTSYSHLQELQAGDFIYPKLMAWEGAFATVDEEFSGYYVSPEFCIFRPSKAAVDSRYLELLFRWRPLWEEVAGRSPGTNVRRRRLHPKDFLERTIPLPDLMEQERVVAKLNGLIGRARTLGDLSKRAIELTPVLIDSAIQGVFTIGVESGWSLVRLAKVADINPPPEALGSEDVVSFVPMAAVDEHTGTIARPETRLAGEVSSGYKQFRAGDVIFARITPSMQNGKAAVVEGLETEYGLGSTEFHVIRPGERVLAQWIHAVFRTRSFRETAAEHFTGTAGQQRVPASFLEEVEIPVPASVAEQRAALESIGRLARAGEQIRARQREQEMRIEALTPSLLNRAFQGEL